MASLFIKESTAFYILSKGTYYSENDVLEYCYNNNTNKNNMQSSIIFFFFLFRFFSPLGMVPVVALVGFGLFDRGFPVVPLLHFYPSFLHIYLNCGDPGIYLLVPCLLYNQHDLFNMVFSSCPFVIQKIDPFSALHFA